MFTATTTDTRLSFQTSVRGPSRKLNQAGNKNCYDYISKVSSKDQFQIATKAVMNPMMGNPDQRRSTQGLRMQDQADSTATQRSHNLQSNPQSFKSQTQKYNDLTKNGSKQGNRIGEQVGRNPLSLKTSRMDPILYNLRNMVSRQKTEKDDSTVEFSISNSKPIEQFTDYIETRFNAPKKQSMMRKMFQRAFVSIMIPLTLQFGSPNPALASFKEPTYQRLDQGDMIMQKNWGDQEITEIAAVSKSPQFLVNTIDTINSWDNNGELDLARETNLRYLGYANEVGESFQFIFPSFVTPSYAIAYGYCVSDALYKALHYYFSNGEAVSAGVIRAGGDALIFQCFASVLIPGNIIAFIVKQADGTFKKLELDEKQPVLMKWGPTVIGLATIPFIVHPIDFSVEWIMDHTIRILYGMP